MSRRLDGFATLEFLLACGLSALLITVLIREYIHFTSVQHVLQAWVSLQERARFLDYLLRERFEQAGNAHCLSEAQVKQKEAIRGVSYQRQISDQIIIGSCRFYKKRWQFMKTAYFIGRTTRLDDKGRPIFSLYEKPLSGERLELVSHVSRWSLQYGLLKSSGHGAISYVSANKVIDWKSVKSIAIQVVLEAAPLPDQTLYITIALRELMDVHGDSSSDTLKVQ